MYNDVKTMLKRMMGELKKINSETNCFFEFFIDFQLYHHK